VKELSENKGIEVDYNVVEGANHYFPKEHEKQLVKHMAQYIKKHT
jgi:dipeptidyl aminopeptidase/acylaminoacyl peptidase